MKEIFLAGLVLLGSGYQKFQPFRQNEQRRVQQGATPTPVPTPLAPSGLTATAISLTSVDLVWLNNAPLQDGQILQRCSGAACSNFSTILDITPARQGYQDTTAVAGTQYSYRVAAYHSGATSGWSNTASVTLPTLPTAPNTFTATASGGFQVDLTWVDASSNEEGFEVERCLGLSCEDFTTVANVSAGTQSLSDTGLTANTVYCYRTRAYNDYGSSSYANEAGDQTANVTPTPTPTPTATPPPACGDDETLTNAVAAWCLGEADTAVVDSVAAISLAPISSPTFAVTAAAPWDEYSPGVTIAAGQGFYVSGVKSAMNVGTGSANFAVVAKKNAVSAASDVIFSQDSAYAKGMICYWYNQSYERIKCELHNSGVDYSTCTWNTATTNSIPGDNSFHLYEFILDRVAVTLNLKIDGATQGSGCSASAVAGDSLTNTGFWLGTGDSLGTNAFQGTILFYRQKNTVN